MALVDPFLLQHACGIILKEAFHNYPEVAKLSKIIDRLDTLGQQLGLVITQIRKDDDSYIMISFRHLAWELQCWCAVPVNDNPEDLLKLDFPLLSMQSVWRDICEARFESCVKTGIRRVM